MWGRRKARAICRVLKSLLDAGRGPECRSAAAKPYDLRQVCSTVRNLSEHDDGHDDGDEEEEDDGGNGNDGEDGDGDDDARTAPRSRAAAAEAEEEDEEEDEETYDVGEKAVPLAMPRVERQLNKRHQQLKAKFLKLEAAGFNWDDP